MRHNAHRARLRRRWVSAACACRRWCDGISDDGIGQLAALKQLRFLDVRNCAKLSPKALESIERCRSNAAPSGSAFTVLHSLNSPNAKPRRAGSAKRTRLAASAAPLHWLDPMAPVHTPHDATVTVESEAVLL